jgi:hypothetical protein
VLLLPGAARGSATRAAQRMEGGGISRCHRSSSENAPAILDDGAVIAAYERRVISVTLRSPHCASNPPEAVFNPYRLLRGDHPWHPVYP